jgi:hypothetical protein
LIICWFAAEIIRGVGRVQARSVPGWYGGEEYAGNELRFRAHGFYSPFNEAFARLYPRIPLPRLPSIRRVRAVLDVDQWLIGPFVRGGGLAVDKFSRTHLGTPQLYMVWQVAGVVAVVALLFMVVR